MDKFGPNDDKVVMRDEECVKRKENCVPKENRQQLKLYHLMMLACFVVGNEGTTVFGQIYSFLILEYLGVPTSLATGNGVVGGCSALFLIPLIGSFTDKGTNPKTRKLVALALGATVFIVSFWLLLTAALVKIDEGKSEPYNDGSRKVNELDERFTISASNSSKRFECDRMTASIDPPGRLGQHANNMSLLCNSTLLRAQDSSWMPITGVIGLTGFSLLDLGFDLGNSLSRAFVLDHTPPQQHKSILIIISFVAPLAGAVVSIFGVVDFPGLLGRAFNVDGTAAMLAFFALLLTLIVTSSTLCTVLTGLWVARTKQHLLVQQTDKAQCYDVTFQRSFFKGGNPPPQATTEERVVYTGETTKYDREVKVQLSHTNVDKEPLLSDTTPLKSIYTRYTENTESTSEAAHSLVQTSRLFSKRFVILLIATWASMFGMVHFSMFSANALTVGVYRGDPLAPLGTEQNRLYTEGLRKAALGSTFFYLAYFVTGFTNKKLIDRFGERALFIGCHVLHIITTVAFTIVQKLELFYVAMATFGPMRWSLFTIPYILANEYTDESMGLRQTGQPSTNLSKSKAGRVVALIAVLGPVNYLTSSASMGPLLALTGNVWLPLVFSSTGLAMAVLTFLPLVFWK